LEEDFKMIRTTRVLGLFIALCATVTPSFAATAVVKRPVIDTIKITKSFYVASNKTLLVSGSSSNVNARLFLYKSTGAVIGEIQNGAGGKYGGAVFYVGRDPVSLTVVSSLGGKSTFTTQPYHP
jgi:hypothetical protein